MFAADALSSEAVAPLFKAFGALPRLVLAVSGGPDSTALLLLASQWRAARDSGPALLAVTVDHQLRPESASEALQVAALAADLGVPHRTLSWSGPKPRTGLANAARVARYSLLARAARAFGARHVATAHTLDDQAETVVFRLCRGSGVAGLGGMAELSQLPGDPALTLVRPFLSVGKSRLLATLRVAAIPAIDDPSNSDPRFTRARIRAVMPTLAPEGLTAPRLSLLAARARRADEALRWATSRLIQGAIACNDGGTAHSVPAAMLRTWPDEIALRTLQELIERHGNEGTVELGRLEATLASLKEALAAGAHRWRRTLAGASITLLGAALTVTRAPARRKSVPVLASARARKSDGSPPFTRNDGVSPSSLGTE